MSKICLITGATGFIGQHVVSELVKAGYKVLAIGAKEEICQAIFEDNHIRLTANLPLTKETFNQYDVQLYLGDVASEQFIKAVFEQAEQNNIAIEYVLHFAACATIQAARENSLRTWETNYKGTKNLLRQSIEYQKKSLSKINGFFYASTDKVYGEGSRETYQETDILNPLAYPYDQSKAKADKLVRGCAKRYGLPAVVYRFCNVYGPGDYHMTRLIPGTLCRLLLTKEQPILKVYKDYQGLEQPFYRDMIYIKDLTLAIKMLLSYMEIKENREKIKGEAFNLGTTHSYSIKDIIEKLIDYSGVNLPLKKEQTNIGEIKQQCMNYKKLNKVLGFSPRYNLEEGLKETVTWYKINKGKINGKFF